MKDPEKLARDLSVLQNFVDSDTYDSLPEGEQRQYYGMMQALCYATDHCPHGREVGKHLETMIRSIELVGTHHIPPAWMRDK